MPSRFVTCPETAHLETIDYVDSPLGMLVTGCSRFVPACSLCCPRTCAARFDLRARLERIHAVDDDATTLVDFG
jgi:hypothetical protein